MIIEAKATRQSAEQVDPRKKLDLNGPEKLSRMPIYIALLITGIAAFIKSAFPAQSQDEPNLPGPDGDRDAASRDIGRGLRPGSDIDDTITGSIDDEDRPRSSIGGGSSSWDIGFTLPEPVSFNYTSSFKPHGSQVAPFFPAAFTIQPQNDNLSRPPSIAGHGGADATGPGAGAGEDEPGMPESDPPEDDEQDDEDDDDDPVPTGNRAPMTVGPVRLNDVFAGQVVLIGLSHLLFGTSDPDGDTLTVNDITVSGGALVQVGGGWSFMTVPGMLGIITFTYNISDGLLEIVQTASLQVVRNSVLLTPWDDVFAGTPWDDDIDGLAGDDTIDSRAGNDVVVGGLGDDHINGGDGDDQLFGGLGDDIIFGGRGNDIIGGGEGDDRLFGEDGDDIIDGDGGADLLMGGAGDDILDGGSGDDELDGGEGDDTLLAGAGDDMARGGLGDDAIEGQDGDDVLLGDAGDDVVDGGAGDDELDGGEGNDLLLGGSGDDILEGAQGDDQLHGDEGEDTLVGDAGNDLLDGGDDDDTLYGGAGDDTLLGGNDDDEIYGGEGDDTIDAGDGDDEIIGEAGNDVIDGGDGYDVLDYSDFSLSISVDLDHGVATSVEINEDHFTHIEEIIGGQGDDVFVVGATAAVITGGRGNDLFVFTVTDNRPALSHQLVHEILDFVVGDRIHVADYEISRRAERLEEQRFEQFYDDLDSGFDSALPIRVTYAHYDDMDHTIIEADANRDDVYEIAIALHGISVPLNIDSHFA